MDERDQLTVCFAGAGDAFGSGGRFQACISVRAPDAHVLLDCGATSLVALRRARIDPLSVDAILVSHLHGDHFGGLPFVVLDAQFRHRQRPLVVAGPPGVQERVVQAMEVLFPGSAGTRRAFELHFLELPEREPKQIGGFGVTAYPVAHASGAPAYTQRLSRGTRTVAYSGDTAWTETLVEVARGADLFICEAYVFDKVVSYHLSYTTLAEHREELCCRRLVLVHPSADMLNRRGDVTEEIAEDGLVLAI